MSLLPPSLPKIITENSSTNITGLWLFAAAAGFIGVCMVLSIHLARSKNYRPLYALQQPVANNQYKLFTTVDSYSILLSDPIRYTTKRIGHLKLTKTSFVLMILLGSVYLTVLIMAIEWIFRNNN